MKIDIRNRFEAENEPVGFIHVAISIRSPHEKPVRLHPDPKRLRTLSLVFSDNHFARDTNAFGLDQAHAIIDVLERSRNEIEGVMIHCEMGTSCSQAVAMFVDWFEDGSYVRGQNGCPNPHVIHTLLEAHRKYARVT